MLHYKTQIFRFAEAVVIKTIIAQLREDNNLTQARLAQIVGVSRQTIISIESDKYNPSIFLAYKIAKAFNKSIEDVFLFDDEI